MSWYDKSRAIEDENIERLPAELFLLHDSEDLVSVLFDEDNARDELRQLGAIGESVDSEAVSEPSEGRSGFGEFASYARAGIGNENNGGGPKYYHYSFPKHAYIVFSIADDDDRIWMETSYDHANKWAVEQGEDFRFCQYIRYDYVGFRSFDDDEREHDDQFGYFNISGDLVDPIGRMGHETFDEYAEKTDRPTVKQSADIKADKAQ